MDYQWIIGIVATAIGIPAIGLIANWLKSVRLIQKLNLEKIIDHAAEIAVNFTEAWGRTFDQKGEKKMEKAREIFHKELAKYKIKIDDSEVRLEAILNKLKNEL